MKPDEKSISELENAYTTAKAYADAWNDAAAAVAADYDIDAQGLKRYIRAKVSDKLAKLQAELDTVEQLTLALDNTQAEAA